MRVLVTGAGGFIGRRLVRALRDEPALTGDAGRAERINEIIVASRSEDLVREFDDPRVRRIVGDFQNPAFLERLFEKRIDSVFHLAAALTNEAEDDFERGLQVNITSTIRLLELCRLQSNRPRFIFASSLATFGGRLPDAVDDKVYHRPQTSYGTGKAIGELLINDYSRRGFIDGRTLRLPILLVRPFPSKQSIGDRVASLLREPLLGQDLICPLKPETCVAVASVRNATQSLIRLHEIPGDRFGETRAMNMPALTVTLAELADTVENFDYPGTRGKVSWEVDHQVQAIVDSWPSVIVAEEALRLGLRADTNATEILRNFVENYEPHRPAERPNLRFVESVGEKASSDF